MPATHDAESFLDFLRQDLAGYFALKPVLVLLAAIAGTLAIYPTLNFLWTMWIYDPLKSLGMFIPLVSVVLLLRAWRGIGWEMRGTWWGLAVIALTVAAVHLRSQAVLLLVLSASWSLYIPPHGIVIFAYASGVVLLFGGTRLYRAALFPILLLLCVDPVPHIFNVFVDLPLQRISAHVARGFAHVLGFPLTSDQLRLMFTPDFGMFIAPGCNGIRGATTMGYIALVAGYLYRFRLRAWALLVAGAILLGYVFNFLRLCVLVLYYLVALKIVWLQDKATNGDYIIGACLFTIAATLLVLAIRKAGAQTGRDGELAELPDFYVKRRMWRRRRRRTTRLLCTRIIRGWHVFCGGDGAWVGGVCDAVGAVDGAHGDRLYGPAADGVHWELSAADGGVYALAHVEGTAFDRHDHLRVGRVCAQ